MRGKMNETPDWNWKPIRTCIELRQFVVLDDTLMRT